MGEDVRENGLTRKSTVDTAARLDGGSTPSGAALLYPVFCSWCLEKDIKHITRWEPYEHSSGMCLSHRIALSLESQFEIIRGEIEKMRGMLKWEKN